ncbi:cytochrome P450 [Epithele typhae]|uniref:cytochrome P450 n=1 Tax=Epithele typhae TaxID=378194 RepID=UPI0020083E9D|nr:cytochrome P450 [Epithele typhae]KAH9929005.1 cytochrome P450 [Epithele typhae]
MVRLLVTAALTALTPIVIFAVWSSLRPKRSYPPGPPPAFLVGNLKDIPSGGHEWEQWVALAKKYATDVLYLRVLGADIVVISSFEAARELLDKRGAIYSSRPRMVLIKEVMDWAWNLVLMDYGPTFQAYRKVVQSEFTPAVVADKHRAVIQREVATLLGRLLVSPQKLVRHIKLMSGGVIMDISYGHRVLSERDEYVALAVAMRENADGQPGTSIVDVFPPLKYVPAWFPGAGFKRNALIGAQLSRDMRDKPYNAAKRQMVEGTAAPSLATRLLSQHGLETAGVERDEFIKNCCGVVYSAGADTTATALTNFALAMTLYPDLQRRAQDELDGVVGRDRLPTMEDRKRLPYVNNLVKEVLRWKVVTNLGVPHSTTSDDTYEGGYIPKNTTVIANIYAMLHDESVYASPETFNPDRYVPSAENPSGEPDPARAVFGFGRRICPGRFFADESVWLAVASVLHVFTLSVPATAGKSHVRWCSGLVNEPSPFPFEIQPRFEDAREVIARAESE